MADPRYRPLWDRFHDKFIKDKSGCWLWINARGGRDGRGSISNGCKSEEWVDGDKPVIYAHRAAWILYRGTIPFGMKVLHTCDVPSCVNPDHLFLGTQKDNVHDCKSKGRLVPPKYRRGIDVPNAKLSPEAVLDIRQRTKMQKEYASQYGICQQTVSDIWRRKRWGWVTEEH